MAEDVWSFCCCSRKDPDNQVEAYDCVEPLQDEICKISLKEENEEESLQKPEGNPRNKVALLPGHSLMDWIRLGNSGVDLAGVGGKLQSVSMEELTAHYSRDNAWLAIRGNVYNVTRYMNFHPGGAEELMKGAGKDATSLFTEVHPWVNYESILQKCLVGRLVKSKPATQEDLAKAFFDGLTPPSSAPPVAPAGLKMSWTQTSQTITFRIVTGVSSPHVLVRHHDNQIRILVRVRRKLTIFSFRPSAPLEWPCRISVGAESGKVEIQFSKVEEGCWEKHGVEDSDHGKVSAEDSELEAYYRAKVLLVEPVTHNSQRIVVRFEDQVALWIPLGHDVRIRALVEGVDTARRYTPSLPPCAVPPASTPDCIAFLIKRYPEGALTPRIFDKQPGDVVEVGGPGGDFDVRVLAGVQAMYLIAAGTGITPMTRLIAWGLSNSNSVSTIKLLFLNRTEEDIIWKKELDALAQAKPIFSVEYGLSSPGAEWAGLKGRLDGTMLARFLPSGPPSPAAYACACGPQQFTLMVQEKLGAWGWSSRSHCFLG